MIEVAAAEVVVEEEAIAEVTETLDAEAVATEAPAAKEAAEDISDNEVSALESPLASRWKSLRPPLPSLPRWLPRLPSRCPPSLLAREALCFLVFSPHAFDWIVCFQPPRSSLLLSTVAMSLPPTSLSQDSTVVTELAVVEAAVTDAPSPPPVSSAVLTELVVAEVLGALSAAEETTSDDLDELFASLHEERGSSVAEKLREFLFFGVHQMTSAEPFLEFRSCLDTAMAMGLLDSAQLDELQSRLAEGEEMIGRYAEANMRMTEGCSLEQELSVIKEQVQPTMSRERTRNLRRLRLRLPSSRPVGISSFSAEMVRSQPELN
ncbi:unnamed protein product [Prunus brigantina]